MIVKNCIDTGALLTEVEAERKCYLKNTLWRCMLLPLYICTLLYFVSQYGNSAFPSLLSYLLINFFGILVLGALVDIIFYCQRLFVYYYRKKNGAGIIQLSRAFLSIDKGIDDWVMTLSETDILDYRLLLVHKKEFLEVTLKDGKLRRIPLNEVVYMGEGRAFELFIERTGVSLIAPCSIVN